MSHPEAPQLNLDLFRIERAGQAGITLSRGILAREQGADRAMFIDPVNALTDLQDPERSHMTVRLAAELTRTLPRSGSLVYEASLPLDVDLSETETFFRPFNRNQLGLERDGEKRSAALVALVETPQLVLASPLSMIGGQTQEVLSAKLPANEEATQRVAKLVLVFEGSPMKVAIDDGKEITVHRIEYDAESHQLMVDDSDDYGDNSGTNDHEPLKPIRPEDSAGAVIKLPVREKPVRAVSGEQDDDRQLLVV